MAKRTFGNRLRSAYTRFKESPAAIIVTLGFCAFWITLHALLAHFDVDFAWYQVVLSTDASIVATLFIMDNARQFKLLMQILRHIQSVAEAILEATK